MRPWQRRAFATTMAHTTVGDRLMVIDADAGLDDRTHLREDVAPLDWKAALVGVGLGLMIITGAVLVGMALG